MCSHLPIFVFLLLYANSANSQLQYCITPSSGISNWTTQDRCLTLSEFATNSSNYIGNETDIISLVFQTGNHSLDEDLVLSNVNNLSMIKESQDSDSQSVYIECVNGTEKFMINGITSALIRGLHFVGCGGNRVTMTKELTVEDTIFEGTEFDDTSHTTFQGSGTALSLDNVNYAFINRSRFYSYSPGINSEHQDFSEYYELLQLHMAAVGGAICTIASNVSVANSNFMHNSAEIGGAIFAHSSNITITQCTYSYNSATYGGAIATVESSVDIGSSTLSTNEAYNAGGVLGAINSILSIHSDTNFTNNYALNGGVMTTVNGMCSIESSTFTYNNGGGTGGVMFTHGGTFNIANSMFTDNIAFDIGVMYTDGGTFNITNCMFTENRANNSAGIMYVKEGTFNINKSMFTHNMANYCGGVMTTNWGTIHIDNSMFMDNTANYIGGVICTFDGTFNINNSMFIGNTASYYGGIICTFNGTFNVNNSDFTNNTAYAIGGVAWVTRGSFKVTNGTFSYNRAETYGGIMFSSESPTHISDSVFQNNSGSIYTFNSNLNFGGITTFESCVEPDNKTSLTLQEGGAVTSFQSTVTFNGETTLSNNQARQGGAILATESTITVHGRMDVANNRAIGGNGGGISLLQSELEISCLDRYSTSCNPKVTISGNSAERGGGVHATSSTITLRQQGYLHFENNVADNGSGLYLEVNAKLNLLKRDFYNNGAFLIFTDNRATYYGGAVYLADDTNNGACSSNVKCFIQTLALYQNSEDQDIYDRHPENIRFEGNSATERGSNLFGGLLDRCVPSTFAEIYQIEPELRGQYYNGVAYLQNQSNIPAESISSQPVRICFCNEDDEPDCHLQSQTIHAMKGEAFNVSLVAVDHVNRSVVANISSSLVSPDSRFGEDQHIHSIGRQCTNVTFNVFSLRDFATINLFADGPCGNSPLSVQHLDIQFLNCTCPIGFQDSETEMTKCECVCDSRLFPYFTDPNCNFETRSIFRHNTNAWIMYINDTDTPDYVIHPNCPYDYCQPQTDNIRINLNDQNGEDAQCAYNRTGILCGKCKEELSLSLGSSNCRPCKDYWPAVFVAILLLAIVGGILLVTVILALNMTVAVGLLNVFIFYANIVAANSATYFPSSKHRFPAVSVAWLNLDFGFDVCFIYGLNAYIKTWFQLAFPVYIISLVVIIIIVSEYSPRFAALIGKRDPIATLATLILLSYTKLLSITITALSPAYINYPGRSTETVWLPDGNVKYFRGKHAALVIVALFIILIGVPYTIFLFLWQWIVRAPKWKIFKWTRNTKLNAFVDTYHAPYTKEHRYWTGLLLLVRVILYATTCTVSDNPQVPIITTIILVGIIIVIKNSTVYKSLAVHLVETAMYFNLLFLAAFSLYNFKKDPTKQTVVAYVSTIATFFLLVGVIVYHVYLIRKNKKVENEDEINMKPIQPKPPQVTSSEIELPGRMP